MAKILIVSSEEHIRLLYYEELHEIGHQVLTMEGPYQLLERIEEEKPDILITGMRMVDYKWDDVLRDVREHYPDLLIIFNSSRFDFWPKARLIGATECIAKSFDLTELKKMIDKLTDNKQDG